MEFVLKKKGASRLFLYYFTLKNNKKGGDKRAKHTSIVQYSIVHHAVPLAQNVVMSDDIINEREATSGLVSS